MLHSFYPFTYIFFFNCSNNTNIPNEWNFPIKRKPHLLKKCFLGVLRARGLKKWLLCLQHTQQESRVIVTRGTKRVAFLWTNTLHVSPPPPYMAAGRTNGTGLNIRRKAAVFSGKCCHLEPIQSVHEWAMGGLRHKVKKVLPAAL